MHYLIIRELRSSWAYALRIAAKLVFFLLRSVQVILGQRTALVKELLATPTVQFLCDFAPDHRSRCHRLRLRIALLTVCRIPHLLTVAQHTLQITSRASLGWHLIVGVGGQDRRLTPPSALPQLAQGHGR